MDQRRMSKEEFFKGWVLLTNQPWGRNYRGATAEATIQMELYYKHVDKANAVVWQAVCEQAAQGDKWPSLGELKQGLVNHRGYVQEGVKGLTDQRTRRGDEMPEEVRALLSRIGKGM